MNAKQWLRWIAPVVVLVAALIAFRDQLPFLGQAWRAIAHASPLPLLGAVLAAFGAILAMALVMQILLNTERRITSLGPCTSITLASNAWSTTIPGGPALSAWLTFRVHRSWGASAGLCAWFFVISGALSTVWMALIGIVAVFFMGASLSLLTLLASALLTTAVIAALFWATRNPAVLKRWIRFLPARIQAKTTTVIEQIAAIRMSRLEFSAAAVCSLLNQLLDLAVLYFAAWAITGNAPVGVTLAFIMTKLAGAAQITPGGVGTVEAVLAGSLVAASFTLADATAITLIYRAISFVLITIVGWIIYLIQYAGRGFMLVGK